ncbi:GNAT family N-acetyltransferase [Congregibacter litoralis]|uniref:Sortase n=1 Tax=Congregibacter litoralis KT71 TaxID=314285 RepID=A4A356_9GAMM|nr:GNAT family N-acetyltransferase [Congregibacter litoralis]EAQ99123.1 Sortase [Congregibacter litoralis KT71]
MSFQPHDICLRPCRRSDREACLALFDANCPAFFAPNEREDYVLFLDESPESYQVATAAGRVIGAYGVFRRGERVAINWILLAPDAQGMGLGALFMERAVEEARALGGKVLNIAASHLSAPFFQRFGALERGRVTNGWGPGMHRVDMALMIETSKRL